MGCKKEQPRKDPFGPSGFYIQRFSRHPDIERMQSLPLEIPRLSELSWKELAELSGPIVGEPVEIGNPGDGISNAVHQMPLLNHRDVAVSDGIKCEPCAGDHQFGLDTYFGQLTVQGGERLRYLEGIDRPLSGGCFAGGSPVPGGLVLFSVLHLSSFVGSFVEIDVIVFRESNCSSIGTVTAGRCLFGGLSFTGNLDSALTSLRKLF